MSHIRSKNTGIERKIFTLLRERGIYFQKHYKKAPGNPDIALPRKKIAVFLDGDFWHGYQFKKTRDRLPEYWKLKIEANIKRDRRNRGILRKQGWRVLRIWEHQIKKDPGYCIERIIDIIN